jgi:hypothetical protein
VVLKYRNIDKKKYFMNLLKNQKKQQESQPLLNPPPPALPVEPRNGRETGEMKHSCNPKDSKEAT